MSKKFAPHRADIVGSFLRPARLHEARARFHKGEISAAELKTVEDECITALIERQLAAGLEVITDGEFRRSYWHLDFTWGLQGVRHIELEHGYHFHETETTCGSCELTGKISGENHPFVEHFKFVKQFERPGVIARQTIPAPAQFYAELFRGNNTKNTLAIYPDQEELIQDIASAYRTVIKDLAAAGCKNIQFDDCTWGAFCDHSYLKEKIGNDADPELLKAVSLRLNNLALEDRPEGVTITTHVCRGNYHSDWACSGPYDAVSHTLFALENVDAFYLEFDDDRSGSFKPLADVAEGKDVVLGLITTKRAALEDKDHIIRRIHEAAQYVPLEHLYLSPQCGFASCEIGNKLTEEEQWQKIALVQEIAKAVWG